MIVDPVEIIEIVGTVEVVETAVEEVIRVIQTQVQMMIDIGLEVEMTLEVGLEVEEDQANPVLIATSPTMIFSLLQISKRIKKTLYRREKK